MNYGTVEDNAHDARRELLGAVGSLKAAIEMLQPYADLQWEDSGTEGEVINMLRLAGEVGRKAADAQEHIARAVRYGMRLAPEVEARLTAERLAADLADGQAAEEYMTAQGY